MANSVVINILAKVKGLNEVEAMKARLTGLTTTKGFQSAVMGVGISAGMAAWNALGNAVRGAGDIIGEAVADASALQESMSKSNRVFGSAAGAVEEFATTAAKSFGISKQAATEASATFGNLLTGMGLARSEAAQMSVTAVQLAADLASFNNVPVEEALAAIRSGLVGESEPMRRFGVLLNETAVKAQAMKMGLAGARGELSESAKVQARYALILTGSQSAQGDFARTSDGLANSQKALAAQMEDLSAALGEKLLPVMTDIVQFASNDAIPAVDDLARGWGYLEYQQRKAKESGIPLADLLALFPPIGDAIGSSMQDYAESLYEADRYQRAAAASSARLTGQAEALVPNLEDVQKAADDAAKELADLETASRDLWKQFSENRKATTADEKLELRKLPAQIREAQREVARAQKELEKARTKEQKDEAQIRLIEAKQEVVRLQSALTELKGKFASAGEVLGHAFGSSLYQEVKAWNALTRAQIRSLGDVRPYGPGTNSAKPQPRALGGTVWEGETYLVGERRPELFVPSTNGRIVPSVEGGGNVAVAVYLDSDQIAARVERRQYFAASVAPASAR